LPGSGSATPGALPEIAISPPQERAKQTLDRNDPGRRRPLARPPSPPSLPPIAAARLGRWRDSHQAGGPVGQSSRHRQKPHPGASAGADVAAFLAGERGTNLSPETLKLRRAPIRYLHRAASSPVPTHDVCVSETLAGIRRDAAKKGQLPRKKVAATATILRRLLVPIPTDLRGLRDRAILLVGIAGALRRSELAAIRLEHLGKTDRGIRLTLPHRKGAQDSAVTVPPALWRHRALPGPGAAGLAAGRPPHRRASVPSDLVAAASEEGRAAGRPPPLPRIGAAAITAQTVTQVVQARAVAAGFGLRDLGGHSLKRGALTTGIDRGIHPAKLKRLGRHKSFDVLGEDLEFCDLFEGHPLSGVL